MASRISQIVSEVETALGDSTVEFAYGRKAIKEYVGLRRCVWVPVEADLTTHRHDVGGKVHPTTGNREPAVLTRTLRCEVHVWDATSEQEEARLDATETLLHQLYPIIRDYFMGDVRFGTETWATQTNDGADYAVAGEKAVFTVQFDIPVVRESKPLTEITSESTTVTIGWDAFDSGFDSGFLIDTVT